MSIKLNAATGGGSVALDAPNATTGNADVVLTLPVDDGTSGQVLQTDGAGALSFTDVSGLPDAIDVNASAPADSVAISSGGGFLVNSTTSRTNVNTLEPRVQIEGNNNDTSTLAIISNSTADGTAAQIHLCKSSDGTIGNNGAVVNNEALGRITFDGSDGTNFVSAAEILSTCEANAGSNAMTGNLRFYVNNGGSSPSERMRVASNGRTGVFTTDTDSFDVGNSNGTGTSRKTIRLYHSASGIANGTEMFYVSNNGDVRNATGSYSSISDAKLKENIVDAPSQWDDIKALQVRKFNFTEESNQARHTQIGLVAQEVETVCPGLVDADPDLDENGEDLGTVTKGVKYSVLYMKSVKALQEAMTRIEALETANASLEARLTALEGGAS